MALYPDKPLSLAKLFDFFTQANFRKFHKVHNEIPTDLEEIGFSSSII